MRVVTPLLEAPWPTGPNAPELNDIEVVWHDLKAHHLANQTFTDIADLDQAIHQAVQDLNRERVVNLCLVLNVRMVVTLRGFGSPPSSCGANYIPGRYLACGMGLCC
ncbi:MAG: hypothetical protein HQL40_00925 [Alphaproteobacteria bacterium]|nr:hypothetical protein [Alphaproteobacteria bacterium]